MPDLFGGVSLLREWGRIGTQGRHRIELFEDAGSAADASQAAADFVFQGDSLMPVLTAYEVSKQARARIIENFSFAALYNIFLIYHF